jgi:parallel beta-helix repeat protein
VNGKPICYWVNRRDMIVPLDAGYVALVNCTSITIKNLNLTNNVQAVLLASTTNSTITKNNIANNVHGILLCESSSYNTVSENNIAANNYYGVWLLSSNNSIIGNNITANADIGILLWSSSNIIYHNNFVDNRRQVSTFALNVWDNGYPSGGNFWSDYTGADVKSGPYQNEAGSDGIGDTPYVIVGSNRDNYPLTGMFSDFVATSEYHVQTICNSSISDFQFNGTAICFNATGEDDTTGFCRICIPRALMNETYKVFVNGTEVPCNLLPCSNTTHSYLYFSYDLSTQEVIVIPEFPSFLVLPLFMIATLLAVLTFTEYYFVYERTCGIIRTVQTSLDNLSAEYSFHIERLLHHLSKFGLRTNRIWKKHWFSMHAPRL